MLVIIWPLRLLCYLLKSPTRLIRIGLFQFASPLENGGIDNARYFVLAKFMFQLNAIYVPNESSMLSVLLRMKMESPFCLHLRAFCYVFRITPCDSRRIAN